MVAFMLACIRQIQKYAVRGEMMMVLFIGGVLSCVLGVAELHQSCFHLHASHQDCLNGCSISVS